MPFISLAAYGAALSTVGIVWQVAKAWSERRWISTSYNFRGIEDPGNEVVLINNSPKPITLYDRELFWGRRYFWYVRRFMRVGEDPWGPEDTDTGVTLEPYKITPLYYSGDRHFAWRYPTRPGARIYLRARIVGRRRPIILFVYRQDDWEPGWLRRQLVKLGIPYRPWPVYIDESRSSGLDTLDDVPVPEVGARDCESGDAGSSLRAF